MSSEIKQLPKMMGWRDVALFTVTITIGSAIFRVPSEIAKNAGSADRMMLLWLAGLLLSLAGAFVYLELAVRIPRSGSNVVYLNTAFGPATAFVFGWTTLLLTEPAAIAAVARTFADYAGAFLPLTEIQLRLLGAAVIGLHTAAALRSTRCAAGFVSLAGIGKIVALLIVLILSFGLSPVRRPPADALALTAPTITGFALALVSIIWAFDGHLSSTLLAGEVHRPRRDMPLGLICGTLAVAGLYILLCAGFVRVLGFTGVQSSDAVAADAMGVLLGRTGLLMMSAVVMGSTFATVGACVLGISRTFYAMAQDGLFFRPFASIHGRWETPWLSVLLLGVASIVMVSVGNFAFLVRLYVFVAYPFFALVALAAIRLRRYYGPPEEYSMPFYPWPVFVFSGLIGLIVIFGAIDDPPMLFYGPIVVVAGILAYYAWRRRGWTSGRTSEQCAAQNNARHGEINN